MITNDNDIIKALEHCSENGECKDCLANPHKGNYGYCVGGLMKRAIDLINRQKAEIKRLEAEIDAQYEQAKADILGNMADGGVSCHWCIEQHKAEAIEEFAERIEPKLANNINIGLAEYQFVIADINNLVKEMTEEQK